MPECMGMVLNIILHSDFVVFTIVMIENEQNPLKKISGFGRFGDDLDQAASPHRLKLRVGGAGAGD
jgi:hypothetical protein